MDAAGELAKLLERVPELVRGRPEQPLGLVRRRLQLALGQPQRQRERHEPLLGAVVQVALQAPALDARRLDEARAGAAQLLLVALSLGHVHTADQELVVAPVLGERRDRPRDVHPRAVGRMPRVFLLRGGGVGARRLEDHLAHARNVVLGEEDVPEVPVAGGRVVAAARCALERPVEAADAALGVDEAEVARRRLDHGPHELALALEVVEARLQLVVELLQLDLVALALGDVADDEDDLVVADRRDARLEVPPFVERERVLDLVHPAGCEHPADAGHDLLADVGRQDLADVVPEELVRRMHEERLVAGLDVEVVPVVIEPEHEVGERLDEPAQPRLGAGQLRQAPLALERESGGGADALQQVGVVEQRRVVDQHGDAAPAALDDRRGSPGLGVDGQRLDFPGQEAEGALLRKPVGDLERRVVEGAGERVTQLGAARSGIQLEQQPADAGAGELRPQQADRERDRNEQERGERGPGEELGGAVSGRVEGERQREQDDRDAEADERRRERAAHRRRRRAPPADEDDDRRDDQDDPGRLGEEDDPVRQLRAVGDEQPVRRSVELLQVGDQHPERAE